MRAAGAGDGQAAADAAGLAREVLELLRARGETVAVAESLTGGLLAAALTHVPGASVAFRGGVVAYATPLKVLLLGVEPDLLSREGPVHPDVARQLARGARVRLAATYGLATTGVAGPGPADGHDAGTVYVALAGPRGERAVDLALPGDRPAVRRGAVAAALRLLDAELREGVR